MYHTMIVNKYRIRAMIWDVSRPRNGKKGYSSQMRIPPRVRANKIKQTNTSTKSWGLTERCGEGTDPPRWGCACVCRMMDPQGSDGTKNLGNFQTIGGLWVGGASVIRQNPGWNSVEIHRGKDLSQGSHPHCLPLLKYFVAVSFCNGPAFVKHSQCFCSSSSLFLFKFQIRFE